MATENSKIRIGEDTRELRASIKEGEVRKRWESVRIAIMEKMVERERA
jgi:hypothetical protein